MKNMKTVANLVADTVIGDLVAPAELVSAMADGELQGEELTATIQNCADQPDLLARWASYSCVAQALRAPSTASGIANTDFIARFSQRFECEAPHTAAKHLDPLLSPSALKAGAVQSSVPAAVRIPALAANDAQFRWKLVAGLASLFVVVAVAWSSFGAVNPESGGVPQLASASVGAPFNASASPDAPQTAGVPPAEQVVVASPQGPMVRDARTEELMAAHKQISATSAQMPSAFLRNATFESSQRGAGR